MISAKVIKHSIAPSGIKMITFELEYHRFIHSEVMTHKMLSKNAASSRAIPVLKMLEMIEKDPAMPVYWGKNQSGMQAKEELPEDIQERAKAIWLEALSSATIAVKKLVDLGVHKQITNRLLEPWCNIKVVMSGTEWDNLYWLRRHEDAQPEFKVLADLMYKVVSESTPDKLNPGEWHVPYVRTSRDADGKLIYYGHNDEIISMEEARIISASCCAQVSYRKLDDDLEKARDIFTKLMGKDPKHCSPVEHQATPIRHPPIKEPGITHMTTNHDLWSGNLRGWIQFRKLIPNESK